MDPKVLFILLRHNNGSDRQMIIFTHKYSFYIHLKYNWREIRPNVFTKFKPIRMNALFYSVIIVYCISRLIILLMMNSMIGQRIPLSKL